MDFYAIPFQWVEDVLISATQTTGNEKRLVISDGRRKYERVILYSNASSTTFTYYSYLHVCLTYCSHSISRSFQGSKPRTAA